MSAAMVNLDHAAWLGLDLGTQSVRAMLVAGDGAILDVGSHKLASRRHGATHEQDQEEWWQAIATACRQALGAAPAGMPTGSVAVDATSGTVLLVDGEGRALTPGLMYDDTRATTETRRANEAGATQWAAMGYNKIEFSFGLQKLPGCSRTRTTLSTAGWSAPPLPPTRATRSRPTWTSSTNAVRRTCSRR